MIFDHFDYESYETCKTCLLSKLGLGLRRNSR